jgi:hypothetical protein
MANRVTPTPLDADNLSGSFTLAACSDWRSGARRFHVGTGHFEPTHDAGYTTAGLLARPELSINSLLLGGSPYKRLSSIVSLIPDLYFVAIWVGHIDIRIPSREFTAPQNGPSRAFDFGNCDFDITRAPQTKSKMSDATAQTGSIRILLKGNDVVWTRAEHLDRRRVSKILADSEDLRVEPDRAFEVANGETDVREPVGLEHRGARNGA